MYTYWTLLFSKFNPAAPLHTRKTRSKYESSVPQSTPGDSPTAGASPIRAPHHVWQAHTIRFRKEALGRDLSAKGWTPGLRDSGPGLLEKNRIWFSDRIRCRFLKKWGTPKYTILVLKHVETHGFWGSPILRDHHIATVARWRQDTANREQLSPWVSRGEALLRRAA